MQIPNDLDAYFMPFSANRSFKSSPRLISGAEGMFYTTSDGRRIVDGASGLWCVNAGHGRVEIADAVRDQVLGLDFTPSYQVAHPLAFELANRVLEIMPEGYGNVFFTNSGSESVETALKIALAYHQAKGDARRRRLIGRVRGFHGAGFAGTSVGGIAANKRQFANLLPEVDHLNHTHWPDKNAFSKGQPAWGAELADELENLVLLHGADTIAALIVEPLAGAGGVLIPPMGYLERLREICTKHGILLIFDEVITAFGRVGAATAAEKLNIKPDIIALAKGITNGVIPMGAVVIIPDIYEAFMQGPEHMIELFHGYTYSGHPVACAAALATLKIYAEEDLFNRANEMSAYLEEAVHSLNGTKNVIDIRNMGLASAVELEPRDGAPGARGFDVFKACFAENALLRCTGDIMAVAPATIVEKAHIDQMIETLGHMIAVTD